jgi:hypothetical protein
MTKQEIKDLIYLLDAFSRGIDTTEYYMEISESLNTLRQELKVLEEEPEEPKDLQILTYLYEQELSEDYPYEDMLEYSLVNERGYRMFPVFCPKKSDDVVIDLQNPIEIALNVLQERRKISDSLLKRVKVV